MTFEQLFKIFMKFNMFDCIGAIFTYQHGASSTLGPFWVTKLIFSWKNLPVLGSSPFIVMEWTWWWFKQPKKLNSRCDKNNCCRSILRLEFVIQNQPFHRQNDSNFVRVPGTLFQARIGSFLKFRRKISKSYIIERKKKTRKREGDGFRGVGERGYRGGQNRTLLMLDWADGEHGQTVFTHMPFCSARRKLINFRSPPGVGQKFSPPFKHQFSNSNWCIF